VLQYRIPNPKSGYSVSSLSPITSDTIKLTPVPANPSIAMDAPPTYSAHANVQSPFANTETIAEKPDTRSTPTSTADKEPFTVGVIMERVSPAFINPKGKLQPQKVLKVKVSSIQIHADMSAEEFTRQNWDCFNDNFGLHGWKKARRTKSEKAAGATYYPDEAWVRKIADMVTDYEAGMDPVYCVTFSFTKGQREKLENESGMSFSLKKLLDRVLLRGRR
jgi:hypothetical protein